jgi:hypothetical protein
MNMYKVTGPAGISLVRASGKWDACNAQRAADKGVQFLHLDDTDRAFCLAESPSTVTVRFQSDLATYSAEIQP